MAYFHYQYEATSAKSRSLLNKKSVSLFNKIDKQNWKLFAKETSRYYDQYNFKKLKTLTPSQSHINHLWSELKRLILFCDKKIISHRWISSNEDRIKPANVVNCYSSLKKISHILLQFKGQHILNNIYPQDNVWKNIYKTIVKIGLQHAINTSSFHQHIDITTIRDFKQSLKSIYKLLYKLTKVEEEKIIHNKIRYHTEKRCIDFQDNPSRMINSILDHNKKKIVIDRLFVTDNNINKIILDPEEIKNKVNDHFQNVAVPDSTPLPMNERWINQYQPLMIVKE